MWPLPPGANLEGRSVDAVEICRRKDKSAEFTFISDLNMQAIKGGGPQLHQSGAVG